MTVELPLVFEGALRPAIKILTDYPRDDLASDEVQQALVTACAKHRVQPYNLDVGAVPAMDTIVSGFKTAQLAINSSLGFGHILHTNCAPRRNIVTNKSKGEGVVLGFLENGVCLLTVNSGYTLSPFYELMKEGRIKLFETHIPDSGSQFRSRDYFPEGTAHLAAFLQQQLDQLGEDKIKQICANNDAETLFDGFELLGKELTLDHITPLPKSLVWYIDNFGNLKLNITHAELEEYHNAGDILSLVIGDKVVDAIIGKAGFSQGEGIIALTCGSSGWGDENSTNGQLTEVFLRGGSAAEQFKDHVHPGARIFGVKKKDLQNALQIIRENEIQAIGKRDMLFLSEAKLVQVIADDLGLIENGFDCRKLRAAIENGEFAELLKQA